MSKRKRSLPSFQQKAHDLIHNKKHKTNKNQSIKTQSTGLSLDPFAEADSSNEQLRKPSREQPQTTTTTIEIKQSTSLKKKSKKESVTEIKETTISQTTNLFSALVDAGDLSGDDEPTLWTTETAATINQSNQSINQSSHLLFDPNQTNRSDYLSYQLIDSMSEAKTALSVIQKSSLISIDCEGVMLGRNGSVCLLQIAVKGSQTLNQTFKQSIKKQQQSTLKFKKSITTPSHVYHVFLFDLVKLGNDLFDGFDGLLKQILLNPSIRKLFFDCRRDCDALHAHFGLEVKGIIDCQLLEVTARRARSEPARALPGLGRVLSNRFPELHPDLKSIKQSMSDRYTVMPDLWSLRPLDRDLLIYASADVACLFFLFEKQSNDISLDTSGHRSIRNSLDEVQIYTDRVWSRVFIDGSESTEAARQQHLDIVKEENISDEEKELVKKRICSVPEVATIRAASNLQV